MDEIITTTTTEDFPEVSSSQEDPNHDEEEEEDVQGLTLAERIAQKEELLLQMMSNKNFG